MSRPVGVTILAVLSILGGIALLCLGGLSALGGTLFSSQVAAAGGTAAAANSGLLTIIGGAIAVLGVLYIVLAVGLLQLKGWAWLLGIVLSVLSVVGGIAQIVAKPSSLGSQAVTLIISLVILVYLFTPQVRAAFGRG
jgi:uncharacterized membrane protein (DUF2068 family)